MRSPAALGPTSGRVGSVSARAGPAARHLDRVPILGLLHVLAVIGAFGPLLIYPSMQRAGAGATIAQLHLRLPSRR